MDNQETTKVILSVSVGSFIGYTRAEAALAIKHYLDAVDNVITDHSGKFTYNILPSFTRVTSSLAYTVSYSSEGCLYGKPFMTPRPIGLSLCFKTVEGSRDKLTSITVVTE